MNIHSFEVVQDGHFRCKMSREEARTLFSATVTQVSVELISYCNRQCPWCPNAMLDRRGPPTYFSADLYTAILRQLAEIDYSRDLVYSSGFSEPLAYDVFPDRVNEARQVLPNARLHTHTNGDFLTVELLNLLITVGLDRLFVQAYDGLDAMDAAIAQLGLSPDEMTETHPRPHWVEKSTKVLGIDLRFQWRDFSENGTNRGGLVNWLPQINHRRYVPCFEPFWHFNVDYNGSVLSCCQVRLDAPTHGGCELANLYEGEDIYRAYTSQAAARWRQRVVGFQPKRHPCNVCDWKEGDWA